MGKTFNDKDIEDINFVSVKYQTNIFRGKTYDFSVSAQNFISQVRNE